MMNASKYYQEGHDDDLLLFVIREDGSQRDVVEDIMNAEDNERGITVINLDRVVQYYQLWREKLPSVEIYYAMKALNSQGIMKMLHGLGAKFDISSKGEFEECLSIGVDVADVLCTHPYKPDSHVAYYRDQGVSILVVDSETEIDKIMKIYPQASLMIRVDPEPLLKKGGFPLDVKFGATMSEAEELLKYGKKMEMKFVGISFHVGSSINDDTAHNRTIAKCRQLFDVALKIGYKLNVLNLGGGFPSGAELIKFRSFANNINLALERHFPGSSNIRIIAEPGTFFAKPAMDAYLCVIGKRRVSLDKLMKTVVPSSSPPNGEYSPNKSSGDGIAFVYSLNDGIWGSLNYLHVGREDTSFKPLKPIRTDADVYASVLWGPTADILDRLTDIVYWPELSLGDWVMLSNCGSYSYGLRTRFNGITPAKHVTVVSEKYISLIRKHIDHKTDDNE